MSVKDEAQTEMEQALTHLRDELKNLRTGRANPGLLEKVMVEAYGTSMRLIDVANITVPEPRQLVVTPFDAGNVNAVAKGIERANIGLQGMADGNLVRINIPEMDESIRKKMVAECDKLTEQSKVGIRNIRRKFNDLVRKQKSDSEISEDELKSLEKVIQTLTDDHCKQADEIAKSKEKEILTV
jgi:ribosome recycling factor